MWVPFFDIFCLEAALQPFKTLQSSLQLSCPPAPQPGPNLCPLSETARSNNSRKTQNQKELLILSVNLLQKIAAKKSLHTIHGTKPLLLFGSHLRFDFGSDLFWLLVSILVVFVSSQPHCSKFVGAWALIRTSLSIPM